MIFRERSYVRETLDLYVVDPEEMSLLRMKEQIDTFLDSDLPQAVKDEAFLTRYEDSDGFSCWNLVYDRPETDAEMSERIAGETFSAWQELLRRVGELKDAELPRHDLGRSYAQSYAIDKFFLDTAQTYDDLLAIAQIIKSWRPDENSSSPLFPY